MRELFVLQASDWQFMITNWSTRNLGEKRVTERHEDFKRLAKLAWDPRADVEALFDEHCSKAYGKGGDDINRMYRLLAADTGIPPAMVKRLLKT